MTQAESTSRKPSRRFEARRAAIVSSAVEVLNRKGVQGMTLGDVAANLGIVPTGIIYYFKNKEDLAAACLLRAADRFTGLVDAAKACGPDPAVRLSTYLDQLVEERRRIALGEAEEICLFNDVRALNHPEVNAAYDDLFRSTRRLFEHQKLSRIERNARTHILVAEAFWTAAWLPGVDPADYPRTGERMRSILLNGMAAPGAPWSPLPLPELVMPEAAGGEICPGAFLRAATQLINEQGYLGASVEKISARLNVTKGAFYHHNENKDDLVAACFERTFEVMRRAVWAAESVSSSGLQTLASAASALVEYQLKGNAPLLRASALSAVPEPLREELILGFDRLSNRFASIICDGIADGSIRPVDANVAAQLVTAMVNAGASLHHWAPGLTPANAAALYVRALFEGLLSPSAG